MAKVELKQPIVEEIKGFVADAKAAVLVDYRGLTVEEDTRLRRELREVGVVYKVYKNTMLHLAFEGTDFDQLDKHLDGVLVHGAEVRILVGQRERDDSAEGWEALVHSESLHDIFPYSSIGRVTGF